MQNIFFVLIWIFRHIVRRFFFSGILQLKWTTDEKDTRKKTPRKFHDISYASLIAIIRIKINTQQLFFSAFLSVLCVLTVHIVYAVDSCGSKALHINTYSGLWIILLSFPSESVNNSKCENHCNSTQQR